MRATAPAGSLPELQRDEGLCLYGLGRWVDFQTLGSVRTVASGVFERKATNIHHQPNLAKSIDFAMQ
jgi:hypothetical protein